MDYHGSLIGLLPLVSMHNKHKSFLSTLATHFSIEKLAYKLEECLNEEIDKADFPLVSIEDLSLSLMCYT